MIKETHTINTNTEKGLKTAERIQQYMYKKYNNVRVEPDGFDKVTIKGW